MKTRTSVGEAKVGNLEITPTREKRHEVRINGKPILARRVTLVLDIDSLWTAEVEFLPSVESEV